MATETLLMEAVLRGGDRQELHERMRRYSLEAQEAIADGRRQSAARPRRRRRRLPADARRDRRRWLDPRAFTGRSAEQVDEFLAAEVDPVLERDRECRPPVEEPRV